MLVSRLAKVTIEPAVLFYVFAIFAEYAVVEDLLYVSKCFDRLNLTSNEQLHTCVENKKHKGASGKNGTDEWGDISAATNRALLLYNGILYATSILSSFVAAAYSDRRTKLVPILLPVIGSALVQALILLSLLVESANGNALLFSHTSILLVCSFISGITGGTSTLLSNCFAYVAEKSSPTKRTTRITIVEACLFGGGFFGFTYAGAIMRANPNSLYRYFLNFGIFLVIHLILVVYILARRSLFVRPQVTSNDLSGANPWRTCFTLLTSVLKTTFRRRVHAHQRPVILLVLAAFTLISFWNVALTTMLFIYTRNEPLLWPSWMYSYFSSAKFALCGIFLCILPVGQHILSNHFGRRPLADTTIILVGLLSRALSIILIGLATTTPLMIIALVAIILAEYPIPAIRSLLSKIIEPNEKAQMFVFLATIQSLCFFIGGMIFPAVYNAIFSSLSDSSELIGPFNGPGMIFVLVGFFQLVAMIIFMLVDRILTKCNFELVAHQSSETLDE